MANLRNVSYEWRHPMGLCYNMLHVVASWRLRYILHCNTLQHTATHCNTLQHSATLCNTLQHTATHCNALQRSWDIYLQSVGARAAVWGAYKKEMATKYTAAHCNTLQHTATKCNTLQHTATHCNTLGARAVIWGAYEREMDTCCNDNECLLFAQ